MEKAIVTCSCEEKRIAEGEACGMTWEPGHLDELEQLSQRLPFPETLAVPEGMHKVKVESGRCFYWNPTPHAKATCSQFLNTIGCFSWHTHDQREWLIVYEGEMVLEIEGQPKRTLGVGDYAVIEPRTWHKATFGADCEYYAITIPATKDWGVTANERPPDARPRGEPPGEPGP
jgi:quercetin dioxygenase-like cupin family protein